MITRLTVYDINNNSIYTEDFANVKHLLRAKARAQVISERGFWIQNGKKQKYYTAMQIGYVEIEEIDETAKILGFIPRKIKMKNNLQNSEQNA